MMKKMFLVMALVFAGPGFCICEESPVEYHRRQLTGNFYAEGAYYADFNKDGHMDVVAGPFWYEGPGFDTKNDIRPAQTFDPENYSDNFLTYTGDFNADGWPDVLYLPIPSAEAFWYENPAGKNVHWPRRSALKDVGNESPVWGDVDGDGRPDLVFNTTGFLGYATYDVRKPEEPWTFHAVTPPGPYHCFTHGIGVGDINGDGKTDILEANGWWEQPANAASGPWIFHPQKFAEAAAQMLVFDVDGDRLNDVVTAWHCHEYGLVWYQQVRNETGEIAWRQNVILPPDPDLKSDVLRISQMHAFDLADMNGDGLMDFVTGKRFWAHGSQGDLEPNAPAVLYWFELRRNQGQTPQFIPHMIDDNSGVGTQAAAADLNGDAFPDVIVCNKKGTFVHTSRPRKDEAPAH